MLEIHGTVLDEVTTHRRLDRFELQHVLHFLAGDINLLLDTHRTCRHHRQPALDLPRYSVTFELSGLASWKTLWLFNTYISDQLFHLCCVVKAPITQRTRWILCSQFLLVSIVHVLHPCQGAKLAVKYLHFKYMFFILNSILIATFLLLRTF